MLTLIPLAYSENLDPCPGCKRTFISAQALSSEDAAGQGTLVFQVRLLAANAEYNFDKTSVDQSLLERIGQQSTDLDPRIYKQDDIDQLIYKQALLPLDNREVKVYLDTNGNGAADAPSLAPDGSVIAGDQEVCAITTDANGVGSCSIPLTSIPSLQCNNYVISFDPAHQPAAATPAPPAPGAPAPSVDASIYKPSSALVEVCGEFLLPLGSFQNQLTTTCLPVFLLLGLLAASMYAAGRNPMALLDISTPRLPKPKPYGMRRITVATGGPMQRTVLNRQLRLSNKLFDAGTKRLIAELRRSNVSEADIQHFIKTYSYGGLTAKTDRASIAAALRLLAAGHSKDEIEKRLAELQAKAKKVSDDKDTQDLAYQSYMRRIIHVGDESQRGRLDNIENNRRLKVQSHFRALHDAVWHEENAKRAISASGKAAGMPNWFKLQDLGNKIDAQNNGRTQYGYYMNILPRLADRGFVGAFLATRIAAVGKLNQLWKKNLEKGLPVLFGYRRAGASVGNAVDVVADIESGMGGMYHSFERFMALRRYQLSILNSADGKARLRELLKSKSKTIADIDEVTLHQTLDRLATLKAKNMTDAQFEHLSASVKATYDELRHEFEAYKAMPDSNSAKLALLRRIGELSGQLRSQISKVDDQMDGLLLKQRTTNKEKSDLIWEVVGKQKLWELGLFAVEMGALTDEQFHHLIMKKTEKHEDVVEGDLATKYDKYVRAVSETEKKAAQDVLDAELAKQLFKPLYTTLEAMGAREKETAYARLTKMVGSDSMKLLSDVSQRHGLLALLPFDLDKDGNYIIDKERAGKFVSYVGALGSIYSPNASKLEEIVDRQLDKRWDTHELTRMIITNKDAAALGEVIALAALRLQMRLAGTEGGLSGVLPRLAGESDSAYNERVRQHFASQMNQKIQHNLALTKDEEDAVRKEAFSFFLNRRSHGGVDEIRQALIEGATRESLAIGTEGLTPFIRFTGGGMLDLADMHGRMERDEVIANAMANKGILSGAKITADQLGKGIWIATPDQGFIPFDTTAMKKVIKDDKTGKETERIAFSVGGMDKVINGKLAITPAGDVKIVETNAWYNRVGKRLDSYLFTVFEDFSNDQVEAKALLKYNKQTARAMEHGPIATLGIGTSGGATGAFAGEYSELVERKMHFVDFITDLEKKNAAWRRAQQKSTEISEEERKRLEKNVRDNEDKVRQAYSEIRHLEREMRSEGEARYHDAFFRFARNFREIDDTLTVGKTQRALSSTWGSTAFTDMLYNFGLATPWSPWHGIRGRIPLGTPVAMALQPGWMIGKYFAEKMRPYSLLASNMPAYWETQEFSMRSQWKDAIKSTIPLSPESFKFWHVTIPVFRNPKTYKAVETDADIWGAYGYEIIQELKSQKRALEDAAKAARDKAERERLEQETVKQQKLIDDEFYMLQRGFYRQINEDGSLPNAATAMTDTYRSIYLTDGEKKKADGTHDSDKHLKVDQNGNLLSGEIADAGTNLSVDDANMRILPPTLHRTVIGTMPVERLEDYFLDLGVIAEKFPGLSWLARLPIAPAYYDFDSFEPNDDRHGRTGFFGKHYAYHAQVGSITGIAGVVSAIPGIGHYMAEALAYIPAPLGTEFGHLGAKTGSVSIFGKSVPLAGEYVERGLAGSSQMWMKYNATYEQMPLYRMGEGMPVAGITYFSPYKYMDPNLVQALTGKYKYLVEPHEMVTAYPHLADEFTREMDITELMQRRRQELSMFQHMSLGQAGGMIPALGMLQALPIALSVAGLPYEKVQKLRGIITPQEHLYRALSGMSRVNREQSIISQGLYMPCSRCGLTGRSGQHCPGCGSYLALK
ncbi:MAG: hypothetical protein WC759_03285 [Candidatus Micrarchaeia archaeon]|jgi:hypothetical protein